MGEGGLTEGGGGLNISPSAGSVSIPSIGFKNMIVSEPYRYT
jgi:hypothetical protein